jgi:type I restriction enzyme S subunit
MKSGESWGRLGMKCKRYTLSELVTIKYGKNQKKVLSEDGAIPIYGTGGLMGYATEALYSKPSVLIGRKGTIGKVKYVDHPFWTVDTLFYTVVNSEIVLPKYLYYVMSQIDLNAYNEGTTIPSLRTETLYRLEFDIPSLADQREILAYLEPISRKIELNNAINNNLAA